MAILLSTSKSYSHRVTHGIVSSFQWVNEEPAMVLWPVKKPSDRSGAFVLCLSAAYKYAKSNGEPELHYLIPQAIQAAKVMGLDPTKYTVNNIATIILDGLPDLVSMPPEPTGMNKKQEEEVGEAKIMVNGETIMHEALTVPDSL